MNKEIEAVILAGGRGKRMGELVDANQKCLLLVEEKPILSHILDGIQTAFGSARIVVATGYKGEMVKKHFGSKYRNVSLEYVHNPDSLETKRRLLLAEGLLKGDFLFLAGDIIAHPSQLQKVATIFDKERYDGILGTISGATKHEPAMSHALIEAKDGRVERLIFPPSDISKENHLREMHIAYYGKHFLDVLRNSSSAVAYISSVISLAIEQGQKFAVETYFDNWYHFVKPEDLRVNIAFDCNRNDLKSRHA